MMTNTEYNIVLTYWKFHLNLKFSFTNFDVVPGIDSGMYDISVVAAV
jgi:hypothetical protein